MSSPPTPLANQVRGFRAQRGWSQADLAERAGLSRSGVSAIEQGRLVPSIAAALALAAALEARVEDLFALPSRPKSPTWAWEPPSGTSPWWEAVVGGCTWRYPVEKTLIGQIPWDGNPQGSTTTQATPSQSTSIQTTIVLAGCDPAVGILARILAQQSGVRLIPILRSSRSALELLREGRVHLAGVHLGDNEAEVRSLLGTGHSLIRVAIWEEGLALEPGHRFGSIRSAVRANLRWVGREEGSGAKRCMDHLFEGSTRRRAGKLPLASDHEGVAGAIRDGWAQAGICIRLAAAQANLDFLPVQTEELDLCTRPELLDSPGIRAVVQAIRSSFFRGQVGSLPGYDTTSSGEVRRVG